MVLINNKNKQEKNSDVLKIIIMLSLSFFTLGMIGNGFYSLLPFIRDEFVLTRTQVGYYSLFFSASGAALVIFTGSIVDRIGPKKSIILGVGFTGFILLFYGLSPSYTVLLFLALLVGLSSSIITPAIGKGVIITVPLEKRAVSLGITQVGWHLGAMAGASLLPVLGASFGWRTAVQVAAVVVLLTEILYYKFYQEKNDSGILNAIESKKEKEPSFKDKILSIFKNKPLFQMCIWGILVGISMGAVLPHFVVFLSEDLNVSKVAAGIVFSIFMFGGIICKLVWGWFSDILLKGNRRLSLFIITLIIGIMYLFFGLFLNTPHISSIVIYISSFFLGFSVFGSFGVYLVAIIEFAGDKQAGIATGVSQLFMRIGMLIAPLVFGFIADIRGNYGYSWLIFGLFIILFSPLFLLQGRSHLIENR